MKHTRVLVLGVAVLALVGVTAFVLVRRVQAPNRGWHDTKVAALGLSPDRTVIWAQTAGYDSPSCTRTRMRVDRHESVWTVRVQVKRVQDFCTLEACINPGGDSTSVHPGSLVVPDSQHRDGIPCQVLEKRLDEPVPTNTRLVVG